MSDCVVRFGGSSISNSTVLETFASLLSQTGKRVIIVISAVPEILQTIDQGIYSLIRRTTSSKQVIDELNSIVDDIQNHFPVSGSDPDLTREMENLRSLLKGIEYTGDYSLTLKDQVLSYSERISARLVNQFLSIRGIQSTVLFPEEIDLFATDEFGNASVIFESSENLNALIPSGISLIPGSFGKTTEGKIARLGRNSTDYSAASITQLTKAKSLELWEIDKEFRTSDSDLVPDSALIPRLTYAEASELSYFSEFSIHPRIVEPLIANHIPIHVYKLSQSGKELTTIINSESFVSEQIVKSVVHTDDIAVLQLNGPGVGFKPGILAKVTSAFHHESINIRSVITAQVSINIILNKNEIEKAKQICQRLALRTVSEIVIEDQVSLIAVIGHGMQQNHGVSAKLFTAVAQNKINVILSGSGASDLVSYLIVDQKDTPKAIKEIHKAFF